MSSTPILVGMDFDEIHTNLKTYFQSNPVYTDYNFDGSGLTQILNILAYNTSMNAYMANAITNESFFG